MSQVNILLKVLSDAGVVINPASEGTLALVKAALDTINNTLKAALDLETSLWTDNSGAYYVRRETVNEGTGAITITFTDAAGNIVAPGAGLRPLATTGKVVEQAYFDATAGGTGYSSGDILARVSIIDPSATPPSVVALWLNVTSGATLSTPPTGGTYVEVTKNVTEVNSAAVLAKLAPLISNRAQVDAHILARYRIADVDETTTKHWYGYLAVNGDWYILQEDTSVSPVTYRYANLSNNGTITGGYSGAGATKAWVNRATLTYGYLNTLTGL